METSILNELVGLINNEVINYVNNITAYDFIPLILGAGIYITSYALFYQTERSSYRNGQIDAIRGIIKWKLDRNEDGEEVWVEIKDKQNEQQA